MMATSAFNEKFEFIKTDNTIKTREQQQFTSRKISKSNKTTPVFLKYITNFCRLVTCPWLAAPSPKSVTQTRPLLRYWWANAIPAPNGT